MAHDQHTFNRGYRTNFLGNDPYVATRGEHLRHHKTSLSVVLTGGTGEREAIFQDPHGYKLGDDWGLSHRMDGQPNRPSFLEGQ